MKRGIFEKNGSMLSPRMSRHVGRQEGWLSTPNLRLFSLFRHADRNPEMDDVDPFIFRYDGIQMDRDSNSETATKSSLEQRLNVVTRGRHDIGNTGRN